MFKLFKKKIKLVAPLTGEAKPLTAVGDAVFANNLVGKGLAIVPTSGHVLSPIKGKIIQISSTLHAYGILSDDGVEILIHCGIDTVELKGEGFISHVAVGDLVNSGDPIATMDLDFIQSQNKGIITPIVITNHDNFTTLDMTYGSTIKGDSTIIEIEK